MFPFPANIHSTLASKLLRFVFANTFIHRYDTVQLSYLEAVPAPLRGRKPDESLELGLELDPGLEPAFEPKNQFLLSRIDFVTQPGPYTMKLLTAIWENTCCSD